MKIMIAPDSFKESLSAKEVAKSLKAGFQKVFPEAEYDLMPVGDGGEGTIAALIDNLGLTPEKISLPHAYAEDGMATVAIAGQEAFFEMAAICGLEQVTIEHRNPLILSSQGVGEMIVHLVKKGMTKLTIGVGGSATNDGGIGMAAGLGYRFYDKDNRLLEPIGANLHKIRRVDSDRALDLSGIDLNVITDVSNPLCGPYGATYVFGKQKGLNEEKFTEVDEAMATFYQAFAPELVTQSGAGAGGGMAAGLLAFAKANLVSGIDFVLDQIQFDQRVSHADLVIVGEGRMDAQSLAGKAPVGIAKRTPLEIPVIAICGSLAADLPDFPIAGIQAAFPIIPTVSTKEDILGQAPKNLERTALNIAQVLKLGHTF